MASSLKTEWGYQVISEHDKELFLAIAISLDGDAWVSVSEEMYMMYRFRNYFGGGLSVPVYNALIIMAEAIRRHEEN